MRLNVLLSREPFEKIFKNTLESFLTENYHWQGEILWNRGNKIKSDSNYFLVNRNLNIIFPEKLSKRYLDLIAKGASFHRNLFNYVLRFIYCKLSVSYFARSFFSSDSVVITNHRDSFDSWIILGGNTSIKIIDTLNKYCLVLNKKGFSDNFFKNSLFIRNYFPEITSPALIDYDIDKGWCKEKLVSGFPLESYRSKNIKKNALQVAKEKMYSMYCKSRETVNLKSYLESILKNINIEISNLNESYDNYLRNKILKLTKNLSNNILLKNLNLLFLISYTHGDFHEGNIMLGHLKNSVNIIDWEYAEKRSIFFDAIFIELRTSMPRGISKRIKDLLENKFQKKEKILWCTQEDFSNKNLSCYIFVFLLEIIYLRLRESNMAKNIKSNKGLLILIKELDLFLNV